MKLKQNCMVSLKTTASCETLSRVWNEDTVWYAADRSWLSCLFVCFWRDSSQWAMASSFTRFLDHTQRRSTVGGRTSLDEWSARRRDHYLTTLTTDKHPCRPVGFEPTISAGKRPHTYALDRAATGTGRSWLIRRVNTAVKQDFIKEWILSA